MTTATQVDARKHPHTAADALVLAREVEEIYAAKGQNLVYLDLRQGQPDVATLKSVLLGPTGNLRAPTLRRGKTLVVGFHEPTYKKVFGS